MATHGINSNLVPSSSCRADPIIPMFQEFLILKYPPLRLKGGKKRSAGRISSIKSKETKRRRGISENKSAVKGKNEFAPLVLALIPITASADAAAAQRSLLAACTHQSESPIDKIKYLDAPPPSDGFTMSAAHCTVQLPPQCAGGSAMRVTFITVSGTDPNELLDAAKVHL
jgi:hypothetical protein